MKLKETLILGFALMSIVFAQIPRTISYQGVLKDEGGALIPVGDYAMTFSIYTAASGTGALWTEAHASVEVVNGVFTVILGSTKSLDLTFDSQYYLGVTVGTGNEMTPRIPLTSTPYSLRALTIADSSVTNEKLAISAVTSEKIQDGTIQRVDVGSTFKAPYADTSDYALTAVPGGNAGGDLTGTYPNPTIADGSVTGSNILDGTISGSDIASSAALNVASLTTSDSVGIGTASPNEIVTISGALSLIELDATALPDSTAGYGKVYVNQSDGKLYFVDNAGNRLDLTAAAAGVGEINTVSNVGTAGVGVFKEKIGADFRLKKINAGSNKVTISDDATNNEVDIDVTEASLTLDNLGGTLGVAKGGTGAGDAAGARANLGLGSIAIQDASTVAITGGVITGITDLAIADGGTGATTASSARTNLGVAVGSDVQAYDADLAAIAALAKTDGNLIVGNGTVWVAESGATARTSLGLGSLATQAANSVDIDGGAMDGVTIGGNSSAAGTFANLQTGSAGSDGQLTIYSEQGVTDYSVVIKPNAAMTQDATLTLPPDDGAADQVLTTDGSGALSWTSATTGDITAVGDVTSGAAFNGTLGNILTFEGTGGGAGDIILQGDAAPSVSDVTVTIPASTGTLYISGGTDVAVADGGTGLSTFGGTNSILYTTAADALASIPSGNSGVLVTNGSGVPSIAADIPAGVTIGGSYVYRIGGTDVAVADGGTGATTAAGARTNLGVAVGSDVQAYDADLAAIAALAKTDGNLIVGNGTAWVAESGVTARTSLGLGSLATQAANSVDIDGGAMDGVTIGGNSSAAGTFASLQTGSAGSDGQLTIYSEQGVTDYSVVIKPNAAMTQVTTLTLPPDDGTADQVLTTDGSGALSWTSATTGDITAVGDVSTGNAFTATAGNDGTTLYFEGATANAFEVALTSADPGSDVTVTIPASTGTLYITGGTDVAVADGGTGSSTASGARTSLGVAVGSDVQAYDADLAAISALAKTDGNLIVGNGTAWVAESGATARTSLGLGSIATQAANSVDIDGGAIDGVTIGGNSSAAGTFANLQTGSAGSDGQLTIYSEQGATDYSVVIQPNAAMTQDATLTLPPDDGAADQVLTTDGSGALSWTSATTGDITAVGDGASGAVFTADGAGNTLYFEGTTANINEIALVGANPGSDVTVTIPASTGTLYITGGADVALADGGTGASTASGARTALGLGSIATQASSSVSITGGSVTGITDLAVADGGTGAGTFTDGGILLGSGTGAFTAMAVLADGAFIVGDGTTDPVAESGATARTSLGLGSIATQASSSVSITGGSVTGITDLLVADGGTGASNAAGAKTNLGFITDLIDDTTPQLGGQLDVNGNSLGNGTLELLKFIEASSAVNEISIQNAATAGFPQILATGDDTNIGFKIDAKGTGDLILQSIATGGVRIDNGLGVGIAPGSNTTANVDRNFSSTTAGEQLRVGGDITLTSGSNFPWGIIVQSLGVTIDGGSHGIAAALGIYPQALTINTGSITEATTLYINDAPTGAGSNYALWVDAGDVKFDGKLAFEGATADAFETTIAVTDPTADRTLTLPDASGTVLISEVAGIADLSDGSTSGGADNLFIGTSAGAGILSTGTLNTGLGVDALKVTTSGDYNTAIGYQALASNTTGSSNTASGISALFTNTTGTDNTASGLQALYLNTVGRYNDASGAAALRSNTEGFYNTASGYHALFANTLAYYNTASGASALAANTTGDNNTAIGYQALTANTTANSNTGIGYWTLKSNTTGSSNSASGQQALGSNTTGSFNTAIGLQALLLNTTASFNTASGYRALANANRTADVNGYNTAVGWKAGDLITTGQLNTIIGAFSNPSVNTAINQVVIGYGATGTGNNFAVIGNANITRLYAASDGAGVLYANATIQSSDERIKENINDMDYGLNFIKKLHPVTYKLKKPEDYPDELKLKFYPDGNVREMSDEEHDKIKTGLIAQEVLTAIQALNIDSDLVTVDDDGFHRLNYANFVVPLIKAVQELSAKVEELESQLNHHEATNADLSAGDITDQFANSN